jgi:hypothetical protein
MPLELTPTSLWMQRGLVHCCHDTYSSAASFIDGVSFRNTHAHVSKRNLLRGVLFVPLPKQDAAFLLASLLLPVCARVIVPSHLLQARNVALFACRTGSFRGALVESCRDRRGWEDEMDPTGPLGDMEGCIAQAKGGRTGSGE